jgi:hypothetical protein
MAKQSYLPSSNQEERRVGGERKKLREREREKVARSTLQLGPTT